MLRPPILCAMLCCASLAAAAQVPPTAHAFEGAWIWDSFQSRLPPSLMGDPHVVAETMLVTHDGDGRFAARTSQTYSDGGRRLIVEDVPEDGRAHPVGSGPVAFSARIEVLQDGSRHMVFRGGGQVHDVRCEVSPDAETLTCAGLHLAADGALGDVTCIYHRDPYTIPVSGLPVTRPDLG